ncbi:hypothetical protein BOTNAR_0020g00110 [Botryotinia narcissicola]|uniref:Uncharacterized protein n=1 Tax=Botryotinia narcissicola TaxID=278944 RepID=A0A4Z1JB42_9HELO|nr:hypothetical protein BOTNAR_0020g00110 [Botryotinia narcissicola]
MLKEPNRYSSYGYKKEKISWERKKERNVKPHSASNAHRIVARMPFGFVQLTALDLPDGSNSPIE